MSVKIIDTLKPKNNGSFPIVEAVDVSVSENLRLPEALEEKADASALAATDATVSMKANAADVATATAELQGEIDQIVISASAEAIVAPEVAAARVDASGTSFVTLKERLDASDDAVVRYQKKYSAMYTGELSSGYNEYETVRLYFGNKYILKNGSSDTESKISVHVVGESSTVIAQNIIAGESREFTCPENGHLKIYSNISDIPFDLYNADDIYTKIENISRDVLRINATATDDEVEYRDFTVSGFLSPTTGQITTNSSFIATDYIEINNENSNVSGLAASNGNYAVFCLYDENKTFISSFAPNIEGYENYKKHITSDARYIRFSARVSDTGTKANITWNIGDDVAIIKDEIQSINQNTPIKSSDFTLQGYISSVTGNFVENTGFKSTAMISIERQGSTISGTGRSNGNYAIVAFYDIFETMISLYAPDTDEMEEYELTIPSGAKFLRLSRRVGDTESTAEISYNISDSVESIANEVNAILEEVKVAKHYYVGYSVSAENYFDSLVDCLWAADAEPDTYKIIHINEGEYDVLEELGGMEHIMSYSQPTYDAYSEGVQPWITNCKIIGEGRVILHFDIDDDTPRDNYWLFSCLNVRGNIEVENIEIHSSNCRYSIHDESSNNFPGSRHIYKNVRLYQNENGGAGGQAFGTGFSAKSIIEITDCYFEKGDTSTVTWSCHCKGGVSINIENSMIVGGLTNYNMRISQVGAVEIDARINNTFIENGLRLSEETGSNVAGKTRVDLVNTYCQVTSSYASNARRSVSYNTISHTKTIVIDVS